MHALAGKTHNASSNGSVDSVKANGTVKKEACSSTKGPAPRLSRPGGEGKRLWPAKNSNMIDLTVSERQRTVGQTTPGSSTSGTPVQQFMERFLRHSSQPAVRSAVSGGMVRPKLEGTKPLSQSKLLIAC